MGRCGPPRSRVGVAALSRRPQTKSDAAARGGSGGGRDCRRRRRRRVVRGSGGCGEGACRGVRCLRRAAAPRLRAGGARAMANGRRTRTTRWSALPVPERWALGEHQLGAGRRGGRALEGMKRVSKSRGMVLVAPLYDSPHPFSVCRKYATCPAASMGRAGLGWAAERSWRQQGSLASDSAQNTRRLGQNTWHMPNSMQNCFLKTELECAGHPPFLFAGFLRSGAARRPPRRFTRSSFAAPVVCL